jgi:hypothetical protein
LILLPPHSDHAPVATHEHVADIIAINKDPTRDIHVMAKPDENFAVIMKGGEFVRNRM